MHLRRFTAFSVFLFLLSSSTLAADIPASQPGLDLELDTGLHVKLASTSGRVSLTSLGQKSGPEWAGPFSDAMSLWRLSLRGPDGRTTILASADAQIRDIRMDGSIARLEWGKELGGELARVGLSIGGDLLPRRDNEPRLSRWNLAATLPAGYTVTRADWPILPNINAVPGTKMAAPCGWGIEYDVKPGMGYEAIYPSLTAAMPFVAFYHNGSGLYVGFHDKQGHHKRLQVKTGQDATAVTFTHVPAEADTAAGRYAPQFDVVVGTFSGDYWEAAQIYRAFTYQTPWGGAHGELPLASSTRPAPAWLRDIDLWLKPEPEPLKNVEACRKAGEFFGVPIALHWYKWHEVPYDTLYPEFFPPKPHFREGVKALQDLGFRVMPYINGRLCDPKSKTWTEEGGEKWAARDEKGKPYTEVYGSKVPLNAMCPATPQWQAKIAGLVDRLVNECGVDGVYIDQISAAYAVPCLRTDHGHSPGGGTFWVDGYRKMLDAIRATLPKDRILTSEENAECWNDQLDALLLVNTPSVDGRRIIPLMPAVYGGRVVEFGFQYLNADDLKNSLPFRAKMAQAFVFGSQLGWVNADWIMADSARSEAEFLRNLARARHGAHDFLLTGRFLGEVEVTGDNPNLKGEGNANKKYAIDLPAVLATAWLSREGELGIAAVNMSDAPHAVELRAPWARLQKCAYDDVQAKSLPLANLPRMQKLTLAPREARVIRLRASTTQTSEPSSSSAAQADRWGPEIRKFVDADRQNPPPAGAVLFIGSSSIRMWKDVAGDFPHTKVINRGFGGSRIADSTRHADEIIFPYRPRLICLYAGDNDLAGGRTPQQAFEDYKAFVTRVREKLPDTPIAYISIKPSPARAKLLEPMRQANELIRDYAARGQKLLYIDVFTPMLGADGQPRVELFGKDRLHMNRQGYDLWKAIIAPYLK